MVMKKDSLFATIVALALALLIYVGVLSLRDYLFPNISILESLFNADISNLKKTRPYLSQVSSYTIDTGQGDHIAHLWSLDFKTQKLTSPGPYEAELLMLSQTSKNHLQAIFQLSILDKKTRNLIEEIDRTYTLGPIKEK